VEMVQQNALRKGSENSPSKEKRKRGTGQAKRRGNNHLETRRDEDPNELLFRILQEKTENDFHGQAGESPVTMNTKIWGEEGVRG